MEIDIPIEYDKLYEYINGNGGRVSDESGVNLKAVAFFQNIRFWLIAREQGVGSSTVIHDYSFVAIERSEGQTFGSEIATHIIPTGIIDDILLADQEPNPEIANEKEIEDWERRVITKVIFERKLLSEFPLRVKELFLSSHEKDELEKSTNGPAATTAPIQRRNNRI